MKLDMETLIIIENTRKYLDYLEKHINNIEKAFQIVKEKCKEEEVFTNNNLYTKLYNDIIRHDITKLSHEEFISYRKFFFSSETEKENVTREEFNAAQKHHQENNSHHWENQTKYCNEKDTEQKVHCTHMLIDQYAMSLAFNDNIKEYYLKNKDKINIPEYANSYFLNMLNILS